MRQLRLPMLSKPTQLCLILCSIDKKDSPRPRSLTNEYSMHVTEYLEDTFDSFLVPIRHTNGALWNPRTVWIEYTPQV